MSFSKAIHTAFRRENILHESHRLEYLLDLPISKSFCQLTNLYVFQRSTFSTSRYLSTSSNEFLKAGQEKRKASKSEGTFVDLGYNVSDEAQYQSALRQIVESTKLMQIFNKEAKEKESPDTWRLIAKSSLDMGMLNFKNGNLEEACQQYSKATDAYEKAASHDPSNWSDEIGIAEALTCIGTIEAERGNRSDALFSLEKSLEKKMKIMNHYSKTRSRGLKVDSAIISLLSHYPFPISPPESCFNPGGEREEAFYDQFICPHPFFVDTINSLGSMLMRVDDAKDDSECIPAATSCFEFVIESLSYCIQHLMRTLESAPQKFQKSPSSVDDQGIEWWSVKALLPASISGTSSGRCWQTSALSIELEKKGVFMENLDTYLGKVYELSQKCSKEFSRGSNQTWESHLLFLLIAYYNLGQCYSISGHFEQGQAILKQALKLVQLQQGSGDMAIRIEELMRAIAEDAATSK